MKQRVCSLAGVCLVLTGLLATGCIPTISPTIEATNTARVTPIPTITLLSPVSAEGVFVLPSPISTSFQLEQARFELREFALNLTTQDLANPDALAAIQSVLIEERWQPARQSAPDGSLAEEKKQVLNAWGYRCENNALYKDGHFSIQARACNEGNATLNLSQTDFVWFLPVENREWGWLVSRYNIDQAWHQRDHFWVMPQYIGDDLLVVSGFLAENGSEVRVERKGQAVFHQTLPGTADCLGAGLQVWEGAHWGLNTEGDVIIDGELVSQTQGYTEAFGLRVVRGKPVYFVAQEQEIKLVLAGQAVPLKYDQIIHHCYPVYQEVFFPLGIQVLPEMLWFFASQGDRWYYVEMEVQE